MSDTVGPNVNSGTQLLSGGAGNGGAGVLVTSVGYYPKEGTRVIGATYNWNTGTSNPNFNEDLSQLVSKSEMTTIQSVWIDNSQCNFPITITVNGTNQVIAVPGQSQGVYPIIFTGTPGYTISSVGNNRYYNFYGQDYTKLLFLNVPISPFSYSSKLFPVDGGTQTVNTLSSSATLKQGPGRCATVIVTTVTAGGNISITDGGSTFLVIPAATPAGTIYSLNYPFFSSLNVAWGATSGAICIAFT